MSSAATAVCLVAVAATPAAARQPVAARALSLEEALRIAEVSSEQIVVARAGVKRARGEQFQARSEYFPELFASAGYTRTLASEFEGIGGEAEPDTAQGPPSEPCGSFMPSPGLPLDERVDSLEAAVRCQSTENPFAAFADLPFGRENQYNLGLSFSQTVFAGGRVRAQNRLAGSSRASAEIELVSTRAQLMLDVSEAYYDAVLADRLVAIAEATLRQADETLSQVQLARQVGNQPEFELLRARVTRDTQEPVLIQRRSTRDLAYMRLRQLLNLPLDAPLALEAELTDEELTPVVALVSEVLGVEVDTAVAARAPVRQAAHAVEAQDALLAVARSQRLPSISLSSQYGRVGYPESGLPAWRDFQTNWTISASAQVPIFTGGRIRGEVLVAEANLEEAEARLMLTQELAALDSRSAVEQLESARATWTSSSGTVEQAERAYTIAEIRYEEGISTQLELTDSRILLQQATANRAQAARDLQVARLRVALLPYLPLGEGGAGQVTDPGAGQLIAPQQAPPQQQMPQRQAVPQQTAGTRTQGN